MELKRILKNTVWYGVIPKLPVLLSILALPLITPFLTSEDYGIMGTITAYSAIATGLCTFGLHVHLTNTFFEYPNTYKSKWNQLLSLMFLGSFFCSIVLSIILYYMLPLQNGLFKTVIIAFIVIPVILVPNQIIANSYYLLINKPEAQIIRNLLAALIGFFLMLYLVWIEKIGYIGWIVSVFSTALISFLLFIKPLWREEKLYPVSIEMEIKDLRNIFIISLPLIPHNLGHILMSSSDRIIMDLYSVSQKEMGIYYNGYQTAEYMNILLLALCTAISPLVQKSYRDKNKNKTLSYFIMASVIAYILICLGSLWMKEFYSLFIRNSELQVASEIAILTIFSYFPVILYFFLSTYIFINKKTNKILWLVFVPALLNIVLNTIFIPIYGYKAAVYTTIISYWLIFFIPLFFPFFKKSFEEMVGTIRLIFYIMILCLFSMVLIIVFNELLWFKISFTFLILFVLFLKRNFLFSMK